LWDSIVDAFELDETELARLVEAVRAVDLLDQLDAAIRWHGAGMDTSARAKAHRQRSRRA
jgi:hypothetical protein